MEFELCIFIVLCLTEFIGLVVFAVYALAWWLSVFKSIILKKPKKEMWCDRHYIFFSIVCIIPGVALFFIAWYAERYLLYH